MAGGNTGKINKPARVRSCSYGRHEKVYFSSSLFPPSAQEAEAEGSSTAEEEGGGTVRDDDQGETETVQE